MLILLSSDYSARYKQDILRCLAAPIGSTVQFRYDKVHIATNTLKLFSNEHASFPQEGLVCSVASAGIGVLEIVPIRRVLVQRPREHGANFSVPLTMGDIASCQDVVLFTADLHKLTSQGTPQRLKEGESPVGSYCFSSELPAGLKTGRTLEIWESTVASLRDQHAYKEEPFFWVTLGIESESVSIDASELHPWPTSVSSGSEYRLLIYHFQPRGGTKPDSKMEVTFGSLLQNVVPPDTKIDSRYDLKSWWFRASESTRTQTTWVRIRTADTWDLDLRLVLNKSFLWPVLSGALVGVPAILALIPQNIGMSLKVFLSLAAVALGVVSALVGSQRTPDKTADKK